MDAITRELIEEFDLESIVGDLAYINEIIFEYGGSKNHHCILIWLTVREKDKLI
ncbi:hypothetical protein [Peribacillus deserti]|uniref:hypothetical protein n=1 Tax=Peribacillus deserti TaxID=673318 RepID=UPI0015E0F3F6|nr:hypothetical protein [Peribacillus deserti]